MNRYENYVDSEIDWVGEIPSHWETVQPKYKLNRVTRPIDDEDEVITCFRDGVVTLRKNRREDGFTNSIKEHGYQQIRPGDLVVHEMDGFAGAIGISDSKGKSTPVYTVVEPDERTELRYITYLLREMSQTGKIESLARSIRERTTDFRWNMWSVIPFPFPIVEEQKLISRYLDKKTEQIDSFIEKIQKKIILLKEQRTSLINQCVTKGLDPNVEMKDSGVEWIGEIPKHWEMKPLKYLVSMKGGGTPNTDTPEFWNGSIPWVSPKDMKSNVISSSEDCITDEGLRNSSTNLIEKGSLLVVFRSGILQRTIPVGINNVPVTLNQDMKSLISESEDFDIKFLYWFIKGNEVNLLQDWSKKGVTVESLETDYLNDFSFPVPPVIEQTMIFGKLETHKDRFEKVINGERTRIELLKEYRQSLISSTVTGKVRVTEDMV